MIASQQQQDWYQYSLGSQFQAFLDVFMWATTGVRSSGAGSLPAVAQIALLLTELLCPPHPLRSTGMREDHLCSQDQEFSLTRVLSLW